MVADKMTIITVDGRLMIATAEATGLSIYSADGTTKYNDTLRAGTSMIPLPKGIYIVHSDSFSKKVIVK